MSTGFRCVRPGSACRAPDIVLVGIDVPDLEGDEDLLALAYRPLELRDQHLALLGADAQIEVGVTRLVRLPCIALMAQQRNGLPWRPPRLLGLTQRTVEVSAPDRMKVEILRRSGRADALNVLSGIAWFIVDLLSIKNREDHTTLPKRK